MGSCSKPVYVQLKCFECQALLRTHGLTGPAKGAISQMYQPAVCRAELRHAIEQAATDCRPGDGGSSCKAAGTAEARVLLPSCSQDPCLASRLVPLLQLAKHTDSRSGGLGCGTCKARLVKSVGMLNHPHSAIMTIHCVLIPDHLTVSLLSCHFSVFFTLHLRPRAPLPAMPSSNVLPQCYTVLCCCTWPNLTAGCILTS